ncbi:MAG: prolyl oligopeptidase family serine peptidase [Myxococcales bacterium]|nr:prolyl oligopeptidase family serine peptidase [Myxococcales bacterium]
MSRARAALGFWLCLAGCRAPLRTQNVGRAAHRDAPPFQGRFPREPGHHRVSFQVRQNTREVELWVPRLRDDEPNPPVVLALHGTGCTNTALVDDAHIERLALEGGAIVIAPRAEAQPAGDWDHDGEACYWNTTDHDPDTNPDLALVRALVAAAVRDLHGDEARTYVMGDSNGAFFTVTVAAVLRNRFAAMASNSGGLVPCPTTQSCHFVTNATQCEAVAQAPNRCHCAGPVHPVAITPGMPPAFVSHGTADTTVSVQYSCALAARLRATGVDVRVQLRPGDDHGIAPDFLQSAWAFLRRHRLAER